MATAGCSVRSFSVEHLFSGFPHHFLAFSSLTCGAYLVPMGVWVHHLWARLLPDLPGYSLSFVVFYQEGKSQVRHLDLAMGFSTTMQSSERHRLVTMSRGKKNPCECHCGPYVWHHTQSWTPEGFQPSPWLYLAAWMGDTSRYRLGGCCWQVQLAKDLKTGKYHGFI